MMRLTGRRKILTAYDEINTENVLQAFADANGMHIANRAEIRYLFNYFRGVQPIKNRQKTVRPDICHNTVINHASEIVSFKVSYLLGDPIVYVTRKSGEGLTERINALNDYMYLAGKQSADKELADDFTICGQAYRFIYPRKDYTPDSDVAPFEIQTLDPHNTFVAYKMTSAKTAEPVFAVTSVYRKNEGWLRDLFTKDTHYIIQDQKVTAEPNLLGEVPIIEYINNEFRIGAFEPVIDLLDAANVLESNRIEATEQNVQSLTWFNDIDLDDAEIENLRKNPSAFVFTRTVKDATSPDIKVIAVNLQQQDQQVLQNDIYKKILTIVGMPSIGDGNTADSSNNGSTIVRNGWQHAEARAKDTATLWERSDKRFLRLALKICSDLGASDVEGLKESDIVGKFTRRNYEDIMTKSTVLTTLLGCDKVHPEVAYQVCGLAVDPEEACTMGLEWYEEQTKRSIELAKEGITQRSGWRYANRYQSGYGVVAEDQRGAFDRDSDRAESGT